MGIDEVVIHKYSSILSAYGMALADVIHESLEPSSAVLSAETLPALQHRMDYLLVKAREQLQDQGFTDEKLRYERYLNLRYSGTSTAPMVQEPQDGDFATASRDRYLVEFSFHVPGRAILVDDIRVRGIASDNISTGNESLAKQRPDIIDPIRLSIFDHRFMSIAEQMGQTLQKTSVSLNIKECLDFSCAIFGPDGGLVANAPHVPAHLGSMQHAVKYQHELNKGALKPGDVLLTNSPGKFLFNLPRCERGALTCEKSLEELTCQISLPFRPFLMPRATRLSSTLHLEVIIAILVGWRVSLATLAARTWSRGGCH